MKAIQELAEYVAAATVEYRKGAEVERHGVTTEIYAMPHTDNAPTSTVDAGFITVGLTDQPAMPDRLVDLIRAALAEPGEFVTMSAQDFLGGPSYITTGAWIGSQDLALRLYGLMEHYGLAEVVTPAKLGFTGPMARELMGDGFVMFASSQALRDALDVMCR